MRNSRIQFTKIVARSRSTATRRLADFVEKGKREKKKRKSLNNRGTAAGDYPGIIPAPFAIARDYHRSIRLLTQSLVNTDGRVATSYPLAIELFSVGRVHPEAGNTTGKNSYIKIEIFPVLSENG